MCFALSGPAMVRAPHAGAWLLRVSGDVCDQQAQMLHPCPFLHWLLFHTDSVSGSVSVWRAWCP